MKSLILCALLTGCGPSEMQKDAIDRFHAEVSNLIKGDRIALCAGIDVYSLQKESQKKRKEAA